MIDRIRDWKKQIAQTVLPLLLIPAVIVLDAPQKIKDILVQTNVDISDLKWYVRVAIELGKWPLIIFALFFIYSAIRKANKETVLKQNLPNVIVWHSMPGYWFCRYILNYRKVSLTRVPIPVQFKLAWAGWFSEYQIMEGVTEKEKGSDTVTVEKFQDDPITSTINLVLADTYPLNWREKLPAELLNLTTIVIERTGEKGVRYYSPDYISEITKVVHDLPANVIAINLFATINAAHSYHIVNDVFKTGGRDTLKHLRVYQQTSGIWVFEGKYKQIF